MLAARNDLAVALDCDSALAMAGQYQQFADTDCGRNLHGLTVEGDPEVCCTHAATIARRTSGASAVEQSSTRRKAANPESAEHLAGIAPCP